MLSIKSKTIAISLFVAATFMTSNVVLAQAIERPQFGVINVQNIFDISNLGKKTKKDLEKYNEKENSKLTSFRSKLQKEAKAIQAEEKKTKKRDLKKEKALEVEIGKFSKEQMAVNAEIGAFTMKEMNRFLSALKQSSERVAKRHHMIGIIAAHPIRGAAVQTFRTSRFVWLDKNVDITTEVIKDINLHK